MPPSNRLRIVCSACCHAMTKMAGEEMRFGLRRGISCEPLMRGEIERRITIAGLVLSTASMVCSSVWQQVTVHPNVRTTSFTSVAASLLVEYITMFFCVIRFRLLLFLRYLPCQSIENGENVKLKMCQSVNNWKKRVFMLVLRIFFVYLQAEFRQKCNLY